MNSKPRHKHHKHHHSGSTGEETYEAADRANQGTVLRHCLAALRSLETNPERDSVIGQLLAALCHSGHLGGLARCHDLAGQAINYYQHPPERRRY